MMFSRVYTFSFMLVSMGLFASASPIVAEEMNVARSNIAARSTPADLIAVLANVKAVIDPLAIKLDGVQDPSDAIVAALDAGVKALADIKLDVNLGPIAQVDVDACVNIIVAIVLEIALGLKTYGPAFLFSNIYGKIDAALAAFITANIQVLGLIKVGLALQLVADVSLLALVKLVLTILSIGLSI